MKNWREATENEDYGNYSGEAENEKMNGWKAALASPADTYIEWCFEEKCKQLSRGYCYITEWRKRKLQYVAITETTIWNFQNYSRHDASHSVAILEAIEAILGKNRIDLLSAGDLWLLLEAAYSHDVGMAMNYGELADLWENDESFQKFIMNCIRDDIGDVSKAAVYYKQIDNLLKHREQLEEIDNQSKVEYGKDWPILSYKYFFILINEYIRMHHAERVERLQQVIDKETETVIPFRLYRVSMLVSRMHGKDFEDIFKELTYSTKGFGSGVIHPQFAAAMLRIGDLLDIDNNRFNPYAVKHFGRLPLASMLHMEKHKAITNIDIAEDRINVEAHASEYNVCLLTDEWFGWIDKEVKELICYWNEIVPEALRGCKLKQSNCKVYLKDKGRNHYHLFNSQFQREFTVNKKKMIKLLIGTSIYGGEVEFFREYLQNAMDASKMQLWMDLKNGKYEFQKNPKADRENLTPFDLEDGVYSNYRIKINVDWNDTGDKIVVKIIDQGIGIEYEYFEKLLNIGTGWRGRRCYEDELKQMLKWLMPTGGFGIGIQSAFMVTDSVEILTKTDREVNGYRLCLKSPDKEGSISIEEVYDLPVRGTTVTVEFEPEKVQFWMDSLKKLEEDTGFYLDSERYKFDSENHDEFDPDAVLKYTQTFLYEYIKKIVPNPMFPIEVTCSVQKSKRYCNPYWWKICCWKKSNAWRTKQIVNGKSRYQCIYVNGDLREDTLPDIDGEMKKGKYLILWEHSNCIFQVIWSEKNKRTMDLCYKNVLVRGADKRKLKIYFSYGGFMDFMGFSVKKCLKVHRNSFDEHFSVEKYCHDGFSAYFQFLREMIEEKEEEDEKKGSAAGNVELNKAHFSDIWNDYSGLLLRTVEFNGEFDSSDSKNGEDVHKATRKYDYLIDDNGKLEIREKSETASVNEIINHFSHIYKAAREADEEERKKLPLQGILLKLEEDEYYALREEIKYAEKSLASQKVINWLRGMEAEGHELDSKVVSILTFLRDGIGVVDDIETAEILKQDNKLKKECIILNDNANHTLRFLLLTFYPIEIVPEKEDFYKTLWYKAGKENKRQIFGNKAADQYYPILRVSAVPFQKDHAKEKEGYLLSPLSREKVQNVMKYKEQNKKITYEIFRKIIWGDKGQESQSYHMLIDWVFKHQYDVFLYTRERIVEEYERFLYDVYKECVEETL